MSEEAQVVTWGLTSNTDGNRADIVNLSHLKGVEKIVCGARSTFAISKRNQLWVWGYNGEKYFGYSDSSLSPNPKLLEGFDVQSASSGRGHTAIITSNGKLFTYGSGTYYRLGHDDDSDLDTPKCIINITGLVKQVSCGGLHTSAVTTNGVLWTWGHGGFGALGHGDLNVQSKPKIVESFKDVIEVSNGREHTLVLTNSGVYSFGFGGYGALGHGDNCNRLTPHRINTLNNVIHVASGATYSAALTDDGTIYTWGTSKDGALGHGELTVTKTPKAIEDLEDIVSISCGYYHMVAINSYGEVFTWGSGEAGKLAHSSKEDLNYPKQVEYFQGKAVFQVACGMLHTSFLIDLENLLNQRSQQGNLFQFIVWTISKGKSHLKMADSSLQYMIARPMYNLATTDNTGKTLLHWAAIHNNTDFIQAINSKKHHDASFNINIQDNKGNTGLHLATQSNNIDAAKCLIENGINVNLKNKDGMTAFDFVDSEQTLFKLKKLAGTKDVFISYGLSLEGTPFARNIRVALEDLRIISWMDETSLKAGVKWKEEIKTAISNCHVFVFIVSEKSLTSENCKFELETALEKNKQIFPVIMEKADINSHPYNKLKNFQWVDFTIGNTAQNLLNLTKGIHEYLTSVHVNIRSDRGMASSAEIENTSVATKATRKKSRGATTYTHKSTTQAVSFNQPKILHRFKSEGLKLALIHELGFGDFLQRLLSGAKKAAQRLNINFNSYSGEGNRHKMVSYIGMAISNGTDAIIINHGGKELLVAIEMAIDKGIKILTIDLSIENPLVTEIQQDDFALAFKLCKQLAQDKNGNANVVYASVPSFGGPLIKRDRVWQDYKWQYEGLNEVASYGTVNNKVTETSKEDMLKIIKLYPFADTVLAMWDQFALGAVKAIMEAGVEGRYSVYTLDVSNDVIATLQTPNSPLKCTVALDPWLIGNMSVRCAHAWFNSEILPRYILMEPVLISQGFVVSNNISNMEQLVFKLDSMKEDHLVKTYSFLKDNSVSELFPIKEVSTLSISSEKVAPDSKPKTVIKKEPTQPFKFHPSSHPNKKERKRKLDTQQRPKKVAPSTYNFLGLPFT